MTGTGGSEARGGGIRTSVPVDPGQRSRHSPPRTLARLVSFPCDATRLSIAVLRATVGPAGRGARISLRTVAWGFLPSCARAPEADKPGDERHQEDLAGEHLEHGDNLAHLADRHEVAVAGRGQRRVAEEQVVASLSVVDAGEDIVRFQPPEREVYVPEKQSEKRIDA